MEQIPELSKYIATLGVGGILAAVIFLVYRQDAIAHAKAWQGQSEALMTVVKDNTIAVTALQQTTHALQLTIEALRSEMADREIERLRERRA